MSVSTNAITGDKIQTKSILDTYRNNFDLIFRKVPETVLQSESTTPESIDHETETPTP